MSSYCDFAPGHPLHGPCRDAGCDLPRRGEAMLFARLDRLDAHLLDAVDIRPLRMPRAAEASVLIDAWSS